MTENWTSKNLRENFHWRKLFVIEAAGVRTAAAATLPFIIGQIIGFPALGLLIGLGGLYLSVTDKAGSTFFTLLLATILNAAAMTAGTLVGNEIWLSILLMFVVAFVGGMASAYGEVASQIGFVVVLVFAVALGQPGNFDAGAERFAAFVAGGLLSVIFTLTLWHFNEHTSAQSDFSIEDTAAGKRTRGKIFQRLGENLTFQSLIFRHALRLSVAAAIAIAIYKLFALNHGYWLITTVLVIVKPVFADTRARALERVAGSIGGGAIAVVLAASIKNIVALDVLLIIFGVLAFSHVRNNYGFYVLFLTPFVILMIDAINPGDWQIALTRMLDTVIGGAIALGVSYLLRPKSAFRL